MEICFTRVVFLYVILCFIFVNVSAESGPGPGIEEDVENDIDSSIPRFPREEDKNKNESLVVFLQRVVKKHGDKKVASCIYELAQKSMYELMWMLAGDLDAWLVYDLYKVYSYAQSDQDVLTVFERFRTGNVDRSIVPVVFELDRKYNQFKWWQRVRTRMLENTEKYIAGTLDVKPGNTELMLGQLTQISNIPNLPNIPIPNKEKEEQEEEEEEDLFSK